MYLRNSTNTSAYKIILVYHILPEMLKNLAESFAVTEIQSFKHKSSFFFSGLICDIWGSEKGISDVMLDILREARSSTRNWSAHHEVTMA